MLPPTFAAAVVLAPAAAFPAVHEAAVTAPVDPVVVEARFVAPGAPWEPGHRGVDLAVGSGAPVRALRSGRVAFAGEVAGTPIVSIDHGGWRSTYQPVRALVPVGEPVVAGQAIGLLAAEGGHCAGHCLHLGVISPDGYRDPLPLIRGRPILKPPAVSR